MNYRGGCILFVLFFSMTIDVCADMTGFVLIPGATFEQSVGSKSNGGLVRLEDFEILDHPITNREYKSFIDETGYPVPLHWKDKIIPAGKEEYPVIFVNRYDVNAYCEWLTKKEGRMYRLPTSVEFEYAARGGLSKKKFVWGDDDPVGKANYDMEQNRRFDRWMDYLQPARSGEKNGFGLYGMAGNIWQMATDAPDPATMKFEYRIESFLDIERIIMGGSWARGKEYLQNGYKLSMQVGIRYPDLGFRIVRQPQGAEWAIQPRKLSAVSLGAGKVLLSWALLNLDRKSDAFHIYRASARNHAGFRLTEEPVKTTSFLDETAKPGIRYQYYVRPVNAKGREGARSEWLGFEAAEKPFSVAASFKPLCKQGGMTPVFGDLNGDGTLDCVIRLDNGNQEMSQDPGMPVQIEAFTSYGRSLWRKDLCWHDHCYGSANNVPFAIWDMDNDGKADVITRLQIGDDVFVAILDGMSGFVKYKTPWPAMATDFSKSSTRIHLSIASLDGKHPAVVTQTGLYENEIFTAYDAQLKPLWRYDSFAETSGSGGHKIEVADVNGDGKQEIFDGTTCLNADGTLRWSIYRQHPDIVSIHDYLPKHSGLEVFYIVESSVHAGIYMVDANSGEVLWKKNREDDPRWTHGHSGWTADIWADSEGIECVSDRAGHAADDLALYSAEGKHLLEPFPDGWMPMEWDGDATRELIKGGTIGDFDGKIIIPKTENQPNIPSRSSVLMTADLYGDFRDELICTGTDEDGKSVINVIAADWISPKRFLSKTESLDYRLWLARNMGGGYQSIYDQPLEEEKQ